MDKENAIRHYIELFEICKKWNEKRNASDMGYSTLSPIYSEKVENMESNGKHKCGKMPLMLKNLAETNYGYDEYTLIAVDVGRCPKSSKNGLFKQQKESADF